MRTGFAPSLSPAWAEDLAFWSAQSRRSGQSFLLAMSAWLEIGDCLALARASLTFPQVGWVDVSRQEIVIGLGAADEILAVDAHDAWLAPDRCQERLQTIRGAEELEVRYFGGLAFDPDMAPHAAWPEGLPARFVLPALTLRQRLGEARSRLTVILEVRPDDDEASLAARVALILAPVRNGCGKQPPSCDATRVNVPNERERWETAVRSALSETALIPKIVLSREIRLRSGEPLDPWALFERLDRQTVGHRYCFRFQSSGAFVGATPERLVAIDGRAVRSDCVAGTSRRGTDAAADERLAAELLASDKERREHAFVVDAIRDALAGLCETLEVEASPIVLKLPTVQHLHTPVSGTLLPGISLGTVVGALHPTPAVCGVPRDRAWLAIRRLEDRSRGWYAGAVGWIGRDSCDFAVGIRSALLDAQGATVFAGGGIVPGSDPSAEYDETERKASYLVALLEGSQT